MGLSKPGEEGAWLKHRKIVETECILQLVVAFFNGGRRVVAVVRKKRKYRKGGKYNSTFFSLGEAVPDEMRLSELLLGATYGGRLVM